MRRLATFEPRNNRRLYLLLLNLLLVPLQLPGQEHWMAIELLHRQRETAEQNRVLPSSVRDLRS